MVHWLRLRTSNDGEQIRLLVGELRSHMLCGAAKKKKKVEAKIYSIGNWPVERAVVHAGCRGLEADMAEC